MVATWDWSRTWDCSKNCEMRGDNDGPCSVAQGGFVCSILPPLILPTPQGVPSCERSMCVLSFCVVVARAVLVSVLLTHYTLSALFSHR